MPETSNSVATEMDAISALVTSMEPMDKKARARVIRYLVDRYDIGVTTVFPDAYSYHR